MGAVCRREWASPRPGPGSGSTWVPSPLRGDRLRRPPKAFGGDPSRTGPGDTSRSACRTVSPDSRTLVLP